MAQWAASVMPAGRFFKPGAGGNVPLFIDGCWLEPAERIQVCHPYDGQPLWMASIATVAELNRAVEAAHRALPAMAQIPGHRRYSILSTAVELLKLRLEELALQITLESGKPIRQAKAEVARCIQTFSFAADEARRMSGEVIPLDGQPEGEQRLGLTIRQPLGVIGAITPFNFPLNLVAHKVAPAIAAGNTIVLKPSPSTPAIAASLVALLLQAGLPASAVQLVHGGAEIGEALVTAPHVAMITFTGGGEAGLAIRARAGMKRVTLELGSNSAAIIERDADLKNASARCVFGAFYYSGQSCISLQRIFVHHEAYPEFIDRFLQGTAQLRMGDPRREDTDVGPVISEAAAKRIEEWIGEAVERGATLLAGGHRSGSMVEPTVLTNVDPECRVSSCEAFAPLVVVSPYKQLDDALAVVNRSRYGLNAGIFTRDIHRAFSAALAMEVGTVLVNDIPTYRVENMPYGGVKESGVGREGVRYAVREMTEEKLIIFNLA